MTEEQEEKQVMDEQFEQLFKTEKYRERLQLLAFKDEAVLDVDFPDILDFNMDLAHLLIEEPRHVLEMMQHGAKAQLLIEDAEFFGKVEQLTVRIFSLAEPQPAIRNIRKIHVGKLIMIKGVVTRTTKVNATVTRACFECRRCGDRVFIDQTSGPFLQKPVRCPNPTCQRNGPFQPFPEENTVIDSQKIWLQESSDLLPAGHLPIAKSIELYGANVGLVTPGDKVEVVGIVQLRPKNVGGRELRNAELTLIANSVKKVEKREDTLTDEERAEIKELAADPWIHLKIIKSIVPSIFGYPLVKEAIMYLLFGGVQKQLEDLSIRGEINILLMGDPAVGKSQLLKHVGTVLAPRGLFTSGKGTTGVGLTAAVLKDKASGEWTLEAGALVLADRGVACIDELDKMEEADRNAIHEALEQHTVSIAKAGIVATLNARTAVLAAMNPVHGRINQYTTIVENMNLPVTLLSRFDLIFIMRDAPDKEVDKALSDHILKLHMNTPASAVIPPEKLRKYITHARTIKPHLTQEALQRLQEFYLEQRVKSEEDPLAISARQLEALVRISEARARAALREKVTVEDAEAAINIMTASLRQTSMDFSSGKVDIDLIMSGKPKSLQDKRALIIKVIVALQKETGMVEHQVLLSTLKQDYSIDAVDAEKIILGLLREGIIFNPRQNYYKKV